MQNNRINIRGGVRPLRDSNIELFRIVAMLLIVAHHYVTSSGLTLADGPIFADPLSWRSVFLLLSGAWGKTGINCFMLITGYYMCRSRLTAKKYAKLLLEVVFYRVVIAGIFFLSGKEPFSFTGLLMAVLPITEVSTNFTGAFLCFYLCIPFCNALVHSLSERQHIRLLVVSCFIYVFFGTVKILPVTMNYVSWFIVLYFIASYVRLYPKTIFASKRAWVWATVVSLTVSMLSVLACTWLGARIGRNSPYAFVADSNTFLALATGFSSFMLFKNIKIPTSRVINTVASTTFGVLLIHGNAFVRRWLWGEVVHCVETYDHKLMPLFVLGGTVAVFAACAAMDLCRQYLVERPVFRLWDKLWPRAQQRWKLLEEKICRKCHVSAE